MAHDEEVDGEEIKKEGNCHAVNNIFIFFWGGGKLYEDHDARDRCSHPQNNPSVELLLPSGKLHAYKFVGLNAVI